MAQKVPFSKQNPYGKIPAGGSPAGQKPYPKKPAVPPRKPSLLQRSELLFIFIGALLVTLVVFFVFFRPSDNGDSQNRLPIPERPNPLEKRIADLEAKIEKMEAASQKQGQNQNQGTPTSKEIFQLEQKIARVESGLMLKVDAQIPRITVVEQRINTVEEKMEALSGQVVSRKKTETPAVISSREIGKKKPVANLAKKSAPGKPKKKAPMFHTVKKGETLWSISRKYETTVKELRKLNNLSKNAAIYPGINILVR